MHRTILVSANGGRWKCSAADGAAQAVEGDAGLTEFGVQSALGELLFAPGARKEPARVGNRFEFDHDEARREEFPGISWLPERAQSLSIGRMAISVISAVRGSSRACTTACAMSEG